MALTIETDLPQVPPLGATVDVFEIPSLDLTADAVTEIVRSLGLTGSGTTSTADDHWITYEEGSYLVDVNAQTGGLVYRDLERHGVQTDTPFELTDEDAVGAATRFIEATNIVPAAEAQVAKVTHLRGAGSELEKGEIVETVIDAGVIFSRTVGDMSVTGPGGMLMVNVDPNGDVVGARRIWRPVGDVIGTVSLQPVTAVLSKLEELAAGVAGDTVVTKAELGYFEKAIGDPQTALEPVYAFLHLIKDAEVVFKSATVVHAGDKPFGELEVPKRFPVEVQPERG